HARAGSTVRSALLLCTATLIARKTIAVRGRRTVPSPYRSRCWDSSANHRNSSSERNRRREAEQLRALIELVNAARHAAQQRVAQLGSLVENACELGTPEDNAREGADCGHGRVARRGIEERELAEVVADFEARDLLACAANQRAARSDDVEPVAGV